MKFKSKSPYFALLITAVVLVALSLLPGSVYAWTAPCSPLNQTEVTSDLKIASDGTVYAVIKDIASWNITVFKFNPPSCKGSIISGSGTDFSAVLRPDQVKGPTEAQSPQLAINSHNDIVVSYQVEYKVYFERKRANESSFETPVLVNSDADGGDVAIDDSGNVHYVWYSPGIYYRKYNSNNHLVIDTQTLSSSGDGPSVAADSQGNAHIVWEENSTNPKAIYYQRILADGTLNATKQISQLSDESKYPFIQVDTKDKIHVAWEGSTLGGNYDAYYRHCTNGASSCDAQVNVSNTSGSSLNPDIAVCGTTPFVSWREDVTGAGDWRVFVSSDLGAGQDVTNNQYGDFHQIAGGAGFVGVIYRQDNDHAGFTRQSSSQCAGTPTATFTPTFTPTVTGTATIGPSPTPTGTPTLTQTPTVTPTPGTPQLYDDNDPNIQYISTWHIQQGSPGCLYNGSFHYAASKPKNRAQFTFNGSKIRFWYVQDSPMGVAEVRIDGTLVARVNLNGAAPAQCRKWTSGRMSSGQHTFELRPKRYTGAISLDALMVYP